MAATILGLASSHAYTFIAPENWDRQRQRTRDRFGARYGKVPPEVPLIEGESLEGNARRYARIREGLDRIKTAFAAFAPDVLLLVGDDQNEHYTEYVPQFAFYTGDRLVAVDHRPGGETRRHGIRSDAALAEHLYAQCIDAGFDPVSNKTFPRDELISHAHAQIISLLEPSVPVVPIFVNAIHVPSPAPRRCYAFGEAVRRALDAWPSEIRVAVYASGGMSHFSASFPYEAYVGANQVGSIAENFDREVVGWIRDGDGGRLASLSSTALLESGEVELRAWIVLLGLLGGRKPAWLTYEPFYRAIMGMSVACWP